MSELVGNLLNFVEQIESAQIAYGLYDVHVSGAEILAAFPLEQFDTAQALRELIDQGLLMRLEANPDPLNWVLRSRLSETVRVINKLRQRVVFDRANRDRHRADNSPRLVHDLKFNTRARQVPHRDRPMSTVIAPLRQGDMPELQQVASWLETLFPAERLTFSGFQERSFAEIVGHLLLEPARGERKGLVITASTGAGKTYAFFLPVLAYCLAHKGVRGLAGVKAVCIYPRVALAENQLEDFVKLIYQANQLLPVERAITVGIDSGASPYELVDFKHAADNKLMNQRGWKWDAAAAHYICPFARCPSCEGELAVAQGHPEQIVCVQCHTAHPFILYTKEQLRRTPPDVLVATTESLNYRLMDSTYPMLFGDLHYPPPGMVMLDEIHLQSSTKGTQIAFLLRRLLARLRLGADTYTPRPNVMIVGLSATIAEPEAFFADLTGLNTSATRVVQPEEPELVQAGAEHYLFIKAEQEEDTAVISTLLQTSMAVVHLLPPPSPAEQADGVTKYKMFGFAQSLDIVGRWFYQLADAEKMNANDINARAQHRPEDWPIENTPLYWFRMPGHNRRLFPNFFGQGNAGPVCHCDVNQHPEPGCLFFQEGECWWGLRHGLADPMQLKRKTARDRQTFITPTDDLIITTSALEVGYDDATLMGVIQYQAPANLASFVQRKGRGGRRVGTRPMMVTVFSPYKNLDVFLYQNHHLLVEPRFKKLPLNPVNPFLQRIHGFYALFDYLAYLAARQGLELNLSDYMRREQYRILKLLTARPDVLDGFRDYLASLFDIRDPARLQLLLIGDLQSRWNDGILTRGIQELLMPALRTAFEDNGSGTVKARTTVLNEYLPENLFSDINLPELSVRYGAGKTPIAEPIALGLAETIPGNVTFRGGNGSCWIMPPLGPGAVFMLEDAYTLSADARHEIPIPLEELPARIESIVRNQGRLPRAFVMKRPTAVRLENFGSADGSHWWLDSTTAPGRLFSGATPTGSNIRQIRHASSAYPLQFNQIEAPRTIGRDYAFEPGNTPLMFNDVAERLLRRIEFASEADYGRLLKVRRVVIGTQYSLKPSGPRANPIEGVVTFASRERPNELAALGYEMQTEGITFTLQNWRAAQIAVNGDTRARLKRNFVKHRVVTELMAQPEINYFMAERFAEVMLTTADLATHDLQQSLADFARRCREGDGDLLRLFRLIAKRVYHLSDKNNTAVEQLLNMPLVRATFATVYQEIQQEQPLYEQYLEDTFVHTLKHALKQTCQTLAGVEAMEYVSGYTQLNMDFGALADRRIWIYEVGIGGVGVLRSVQEVLRREPAHFWHTLEQGVQGCETEAEDAFLLGILARSDTELAGLAQAVQVWRQATSGTTRQAALQQVRALVAEWLPTPPAREQLRLLHRVFTDDYLSQRAQLANWRIWHELNTQWVPALTTRLGRLPTPTEARNFLAHSLSHPTLAKQQETRQAYPLCAQLWHLYEQEYTDPDEVRRYFENAISRRLLLNCRDACPTCLDEGPGCQVDPPGLSALTLSRALVQDVFAAIHVARTIDTTGDLATYGPLVEKLFQQDPTSPVILSAPANAPASLAAAISRLTDSGVVDRLERRYPQVTQIKVVGDRLWAWLRLDNPE